MSVHSFGDDAGKCGSLLSGAGTGMIEVSGYFGGFWTAGQNERSRLRDTIQTALGKSLSGK